MFLDHRIIIIRFWPPFTEIHRLSVGEPAADDLFEKKFLLRTDNSDNLLLGAVRQLVIPTIYRRNFRLVSHAVLMIPNKMYKALLT